MLKPSATSCSFPLLPRESSNLSNAPAKLRRACAATQSATGLPRAASFSRLLACWSPLPPLVGERADHFRSDAVPQHDA